MLDLDLTLLREPKRFEDMCFRLARYEFPEVVSLAPSWDGGRDLVVFGRAHNGNADVVFQCKFVKNLATAKPKIKESLDALAKSGRRAALWILCVPVKPSGRFMNWLQGELDERDIEGCLWSRDDLLLRLEQHPDVTQTFFYTVYAELADHFRSENLELFKLALDPECQWNQADPEVLSFGQRGNLGSADLVLDVIVRNKGTVGTAITGIEADVFDRRVKMHGVPGDGLLFSQIAYAVSIQGGREGVHTAECDPPLLVKAGDLERFKIRITDTGYAWNGALRVSLLPGTRPKLDLPALRLFT
jgi:hypothetical protein